MYIFSEPGRYLRHAVLEAAAESAQNCGLGSIAHRQNEREPKLCLVLVVEASE